MTRETKRLPTLQDAVIPSTGTAPRSKRVGDVRSSVDRQHRAGQEGGLVAEQEGHRRGNLVDRARAAERSAAGPFAASRSCRYRPRSRRAARSERCPARPRSRGCRAPSVDCRAPHETDHRVLRCVVGDSRSALPRSPASDAVVTIAPPPSCCANWRNAALRPRKHPHTLTLMTVSNSAAHLRQRCDVRHTRVQVMQVDAAEAPDRRLQRRVHVLLLRESARTPRAGPPSESATATAASPSRSTTTTVAPSAESRRATPSPYRSRRP